MGTGFVPRIQSHQPLLYWQAAFPNGAGHRIAWQMLTPGPNIGGLLHLTWRKESACVRSLVTGVRTRDGDLFFLCAFCARSRQPGRAWARLPTHHAKCAVSWFFPESEAKP